MHANAGVGVMKTLFLGMTAAVLAGCSKGETNDDREWQQYVSQYAESYCDLRAQCDINFAAEFGDEDQCKKSVLTNENKSRECRMQNGCEFDPDEASFCLSAAADISCQEWLDGVLDEKCSDTWSCSGAYQPCAE